MENKTNANTSNTKIINKHIHFLDITKKKATARIASMNVDSLRTNESIRKLALTLKEQNIDIACIQETRNERNDTQEENDYIIIFGGNEEDTHITTNDKNLNLKAGVAIAIKKLYFLW